MARITTLQNLFKELEQHSNKRIIEYFVRNHRKIFRPIHCMPKLIYKGKTVKLINKTRRAIGTELIHIKNHINQQSTQQSSSKSK